MTPHSPLSSAPSSALLPGIAKTGSGKTMTFLVPALLRMALDGRGRHSGGVIRPRLLVMAPTRELAMQSHNVVIEIGGEQGNVTSARLLPGAVV